MNKLRRMIFEQLQVDRVQIIAFLSHPGVIVPDYLRKLPPNAPPGADEQQAVVFDYGQGLARPPAVTLDDRGITSALSFNGVNHPTFIPWEAVVVIRTVDDTFVAGFSGSAIAPAAPPPEPPRRGLKAV